MCGCYLGTALRFELFQCYFRAKVEKNGNDICDLEGADLQLWPSIKLFEPPMPRSVLEWHKGWLYSSGLGDESSTVVNEPLKHMGSWKPMDKPSEISKMLIDTVSNLKDRGLERVHIVPT